MKKQNSLFAWLANTPPMLLLALFVLFGPINSWATGVSSTPTVRNFTASLVVDRIDLTWNNSNKLNLIPSDVTNNYVKTSAANDGSITSLSVSEQGVLSASYNITNQWGYAEFEMVLPGGDKSGVQSITWDYTGKPSGASFYPYFMQNSTWIAWAEGYPNPSNPDDIIWTSPKEASGEGFVSTPNRPFAEWIHGYHSNAFTGQNIHLIGFYVEGSESISDDIEISNIYVNTSINWDAIKIVRQIGTEPTSVSDGTVIDIAAGSTGAYSDNSITTGNTYYYAAFVNEGGNWVKKAATSGLEVLGTEDPELELTETSALLIVGGDTYTITSSTAAGYNGTLEYSVTPASGVVEVSSSGVITAVGAGTAIVRVTAPAVGDYSSDYKDFTVKVLSKAPLQVPTNTYRLNHTNTYSTNATTDIFDGETCLDFYLDNTPLREADWYVYITRNVYEVVFKYGVPAYGFDVTMSLYDPDDLSTPIKTYNRRVDSEAQKKKNVRLLWDLSDLDEEKYYIIRVKNNWQGSHLKVAHIDFEAHNPITIGSEKILDGTNAATSPGVEDFDLNTDEVIESCVDLGGRQTAEWDVTFTRDHYDISLEYGTPDGAVNVTFSIIDPANPETPIISHNHAKSGAGNVTYKLDWKYDDLTGINPSKSYIVRIADTYVDATSKPKIGYIKIKRVDPIEIEDEVVLNATNSITPNISLVTDVDFTGDANPDEAMNLKKGGGNSGTNPVEWEVTIKQGRYNLAFEFGAAVSSNTIRAAIDLIDPDGVEPTRRLQYQEISASAEPGPYAKVRYGACDFTSITEDKSYIVRVSDVHDSYCSLRVRSLTFTPMEPIEIENEVVLDATNSITPDLTIAKDVDFTGDAVNDESMNLRKGTSSGHGTTPVEWEVNIKQGRYRLAFEFGTYSGSGNSLRAKVDLIDPTSAESDKVLMTKYVSNSNFSSNQYVEIALTACDFTEIIENKTYVVRVSDNSGESSCALRVRSLTFTPMMPIEIENEVILNAANSITPNIAIATNVDFTGDSNPDEAMNLRKGGSSPGTNPVEWEVTIARGIYNFAFEFGTHSGSGNSLRAKVDLIDPTSMESDRVLMTKYVSSSNFSSNQYVEIALTACDFTEITENKNYILRVSDNSDPDKYCSLYVRNLTFTPVTPLNIPEVTHLNASNVTLLPTYGTDNFNIDGEGEVECLNIRYHGEAAWFANLTPYVYNITVKYGKPSASSKVRFGIIKVSTGDTIFVQQDDKGGVTEPTTYTAQANLVDLRSSITAGDLCKIFVKDNYPSDGSEPRVAYIDIARATINHTRSGLRVGDFGTICLPFAVEAGDIEGADIYKLVEWPVGACAVTLDQVASMEAGKPYIYQATASEATWRYYPEGEPTAAASVNGLRGSYDRVVITPNDNNYIIYNNKLYYVDNLAYVGINKAYINRTDAEAASAPLTPAPGMRRIYMAVHGEQVVTGLDQITNDKSLMTIKIVKDNQLYIIRDGKTYNAQGQLVNK